MKFRVFIAAVCVVSSLSFAAEKSTENVLVRDAKNYIQTIEKVSKLKIDDQVDVWQTFLSDNPKHTFRKEIEKNIEILQSLTEKKAAGKQGDERDAELYLKALDFSKKLSLNDQIDLWKQFLDENPTSIYRTEAQNRLTRLQRYKAKTFPEKKPVQSAPLKQVAPAAKPTSEAPALAPKSQNTLVSGGLKQIKDPDKALLLASIAGLAVPGIGHWYTEDYVIAGVLSVFRITGLAIGIPGVINSEYEKIYIGAGLSLVSYALDIVDASASADRFNEKHSSAYLLPEIRTGSTLPLFAYSFKF
ncbi:MAG: hypothetical protein IT286_03310 [Proteobacteria bacterium]|jgi:hypothetical protein|nr:hypothetical protein [Pseudomonadota bacterium]